MAKKEKAVAQLSQKELEEYYNRKKLIEDEQKKLDEQKQDFIDRKGLGASVEVGPYVIDVEPVHQDRTDTKKLLETVAQEIGEEKTKRIKESCSKSVDYDKVTVKKLI